MCGCAGERAGFAYPVPLAQLLAVGKPELLRRIRNVILDGIDADRHALGDLRIGQAMTYALAYAPLGGRQYILERGAAALAHRGITLSQHEAIFPTRIRADGVAVVSLNRLHSRVS